MKRVLSLILALVLIVGMVPMAYADATDDAVNEIAIALNAYNDNAKAAFIATMDTYFGLEEANKAGFIGAYGDVLDAISASDFDDKLKSLGMNASVFNAMNDLANENGSGVYNAFKNGTVEELTIAVKNNRDEFVKIFDTDENILRFAKALTSLNDKLTKFTAVKGNVIIDVIEYNENTDVMVGPYEANIRQVVSLNNIFKNTNMSAADISAAMQKICDYYNGLQAPDKASVLALLKLQDVLYIAPATPVTPETPADDEDDNTGTTSPAIPTPLPPKDEEVVIDDDDVTPLGPVNFIDIQSEEWAWAKEAIESLAKVGIITGRNETTFDPAADISRAEYAALMVRLFDLKLDESKAMSFGDVQQDAWYYEVVNIAASNGVMIGYGDDTFKPENNISREEMATVLGRKLEANSYTVQDASNLDKFTDKDSIKVWAKDFAALVVQEGVIKGKTETTFAPEDLATRAESAVMLYRLSQKVPTVLSETN